MAPKLSFPCFLGVLIRALVGKCVIDIADIVFGTWVTPFWNCAVFCLLYSVTSAVNMVGHYARR